MTFRPEKRDELAVCYKPLPLARGQHVPRARAPRSGTSPGGKPSERYRPGRGRRRRQKRAQAREYETIYILRSDVDAETAERVQARVATLSSASTASS